MEGLHPVLNTIYTVISLLCFFKYLRSSDTSQDGKGKFQMEKIYDSIQNIPDRFCNMLNAFQAQMLAGMNNVLKDTNGMQVSRIQMIISDEIQAQWEKIVIVTEQSSKESQKLADLIYNLTSNLNLNNNKLLSDIRGLRESLSSVETNNSLFQSKLNDTIGSLHDRILNTPSREESIKRDEQLINVLCSRFPVPLEMGIRPTNLENAEKFLDKIVKMEANIASLMIMLQTDKVSDSLKKMEFTLNDVRRVLETDLYNYVIKNVPYLVNLHKTLDEKEKHEKQRMLKFSLLNDTC